MKIGVLSDTHNYLDPALPGIFRGVDHILHAGDVGQPWILLQLEEIAPVTAVLGNTDAGLTLRETEICKLGGRTFLIRHIVDPRAPSRELGERIARARPDAVVFGHTHRAHESRTNGTLFLNPGYAGRPRFAEARSVVILHCGSDRLTPEIIPLKTGS